MSVQPCIQRGRNNMHRKLKKTPLKHIKNILKKIQDLLFRNFFKTYKNYDIRKAGNNNKQLWEDINNITNRAWKKESYLLTMSNTLEVSVNSVNEFFINICKNLAKKVRNGSIQLESITIRNPYSMVML